MTAQANLHKPAQSPSTCGRASIAVAVGVWGLAIAAGALYSYQFESTPARTEAALDKWPAQSTCALCSRLPTLVMFVHPRCPCTRASLNELEMLMTHCRGRVDAQVVFFQPQSSPANWAKTDLWESAAGIPGVVPRVDLDGAEQQRFGARVSGEVFMYLPNGDLAFHGGITASRGHAGDNPGRTSLESFLLNHDFAHRTTPVFGCELQSRNFLSSESNAHTQTGSDR